MQARVNVYVYASKCSCMFLYECVRICLFPIINSLNTHGKHTPTEEIKNKTDKQHKTQAMKADENT